MGRQREPPRARGGCLPKEGFAWSLVASDVCGQGEVPAQEAGKRISRRRHLPPELARQIKVWEEKPCQGTVMASVNGITQHVYVWQVVATWGEEGLNCNGILLAGDFSFTSPKH